MTHLPRPLAFWLVAAANLTVPFGAAAPSPLYPVYQRLWGFSALTLTVIFAVYVLALLCTLLTVGSLSDHVGRRPVLALATVTLIASMAVFMTADGVAMLVLARVLQGLATGALVGTLSATLIDLQPAPGLGSTLGSVTPAFGLGVGAVAAGALVQYAPYPRVLVYAVTTLALAAVLVAVAFLPESSPRVGFASRAHLLRTLVPNVSLPREVRMTFLSAVPTLAAGWSLGGLYLSLGSSIAARILGVGNHAGVGAILFAFFVAGAAGAGLAGVVSPSFRLWLSYGSLSAGVLITLVGTATASGADYVTGSVIAGLGFGAAFVGVMASLSEITAPTDRGRVFSAVFVVSYSAFSIPALVAGVAIGAVGLRPTAIAYSAVVVAVTLLAGTLAGRRQLRPVPEQVEVCYARG